MASRESSGRLYTHGDIAKRMTREGMERTPQAIEKAMMEGRLPVAHRTPGGIYLYRSEVVDLFIERARLYERMKLGGSRLTRDWPPELLEQLRPQPVQRSLPLGQD